MERTVIRRKEMIGATLRLGGTPIALDAYATTGLLAVAMGPRGYGKTNAGLLMAEQLSAQGWVSVLIDPENELESLYGSTATNPAALEVSLRERHNSMIVVNARNAEEFIPFGHAILRAADEHRKPIFLMIDEGQLFSASSKRDNGIGEATDIINQFAERGRKRALDLFITALRYTATLQRTIFANKNLTLIGAQEDATGWAALAPQFKATDIRFSDLNALIPGEFFCFARHGVEKIKMPMATALAAVAAKAVRTPRALPTTYNQWSKAMGEITTERLAALDDNMVTLLATVAGLSQQELADGHTALRNEVEARE